MNHTIPCPSCRKPTPLVIAGVCLDCWFRKHPWDPAEQRHRATGECSPLQGAGRDVRRKSRDGRPCAYCCSHGKHTKGCKRPQGVES
jgi:hypothetical protein